MGCDIHMIQEVKINGMWHSYSIPNINRNYELFSVLIDNHPRTRTNFIECPIKIPERGISSDLSIVSKLIWKSWIDDAHSITYINAEEIHYLMKFLTDHKVPIFGENYYYNEGLVFGFLFGDYFSNFYTDKSSFPIELEDIRWVYWFDN